MDITSMVTYIKEFGFQTIVAIWALWMLGKNWGKGDGFQSSLDNIEDSQERIEDVLRRNTEIQTEIATSMKILYTLMSSRNNGGDRDAN